MGRGRDVLLLALCYVAAAAAAAAWNCTNNGTGTCITIVLLSRARFILKWIPLLRIRYVCCTSCRSSRLSDFVTLISASKGIQCHV